jgi:hypothetical protein
MCPAERGYARLRTRAFADAQAIDAVDVRD